MGILAICAVPVPRKMATARKAEVMIIWE